MRGGWGLHLCLGSFLLCARTCAWPFCLSEPLATFLPLVPFPAAALPVFPLPPPWARLGTGCPEEGGGTRRLAGASSSMFSFHVTCWVLDSTLSSSSSS